MSEWKPTATLPKGGMRCLVFFPDLENMPGHGTDTNMVTDHVVEAIAYPDGKFEDPVYNEWDSQGATLWCEIPTPTQKTKEP